MVGRRRDVSHVVRPHQGSGSDRLGWVPSRHIRDLYGSIYQFYTNTGRYGSPRHEERDDAIERVHIDDDRKRVLVVMKDFGTGDRKWLDRLYNIEIPDTKDLFGTAPVTNSVRAYFTLRIIP